MAPPFCLDRVPVVLLNAKSDEPAEKLSDWCAPGQTIAFLGTSGVGKVSLPGHGFIVQRPDGNNDVGPMWWQPLCDAHAVRWH